MEVEKKESGEETIELESAEAEDLGPAGRWTSEGPTVFDPRDRLVASVRFTEEARRIAAALNLVEGMPTDALEAWSTGVICDPINDLAAEIETLLLTEPPPSERRKGERRKADRRRFLTEVRMDHAGKR